jgi:hypothetical protein
MTSRIFYLSVHCIHDWKKCLGVDPLCNMLMCFDLNCPGLSLRSTDLNLELQGHVGCPKYECRLRFACFGELNMFKKTSSRIIVQFLEKNIY